MEMKFPLALRARIILILMLGFQATFFKTFRSRFALGIQFVRRVIKMGFCTKKALKMSLLGHFNL